MPCSYLYEKVQKGPPHVVISIRYPLEGETEELPQHEAQISLILMIRQGSLPEDRYQKHIRIAFQPFSTIAIGEGGKPVPKHYRNSEGITGNC